MEASTHVINRGFATKESSAILWWAGAGFLLVLFEIYLFGSWILSADFHPAVVGPDHIPSATLWWCRIFQTGSVLTFFAVAYWAWKACKRDGQLALEAIIVFGWTLTWWQDPLSWWSRTNWFYNGYLFNMGNWTGEIPGWVNPVSHLAPEPIFFTMFGYMGWFTWASMCAAWSMNFAKRKFPSLGTMSLIVWGWATLAIFDLVVEGTFLRTGVYAMPLVHHSMSLWGGHTYQYPLYEAPFFGSVWAAPGILYFFRDDKGHTIIERGLENVKSVRLRPWLRIFAMAAFINLAYQPYNVIWTYIGMTADATPQGYPSYMRTGQCGEGTQYVCASPDVAVPLLSSTQNPYKGAQ